MNSSATHTMTPEKYFPFSKYMMAYTRYFEDGIIDLDKRIKDRPDFQIFRLEDVIDSVNGVLPPCTQSAYWIVLVKKGTGEKCIGNTVYSIEDHSLFIVPSRTVHSSTYWSTDCSGYVMSFNLDFFLKSAFSMQCILNRKALKCAGKLRLKLEEGQELVATKIFEDLIRVSNGQKSGGRDMLAVKILELLIYCDQYFDGVETSSDLEAQHPIIENFKDLLDRQYNLERGVQHYADALNVHPNYLNFLSKKHIGQNAKEYIDKRIVLESKCLLANLSLRIKEIAYRLGFDDPNNFSTYFQKHAGCSPLSYRNSVTSLAIQLPPARNTPRKQIAS